MLVKRSSGIWIFAALEDFCNTTLRRLNKWCWLTFASPFPCSHVKKIKTIVTLIWYWPFYMFPVSSLSQSGLFAHSSLCVYNVQLFMVAGRKLSTQFKRSSKKRPCMQWLFGFGACCRATGRTVWPQEFVISTGNPERERELLELTTWRPSVVTLPTVLQLSLQFDQDIISWY